ncbi:MAG: glutathione S-transferase [Verrucomicrobiae bacterium]|nr:glutathione S-transferase [Verrucomicrobiae bacterium]
MTLILHELAHSPYCLPVKRILEAWSVPFETRQISAWDRRSLINLTSGAYYQVPVLEYGDRIVHETAADPLAVAHFLDREFCEGGLFPQECVGIHELVIGHIEDKLEGIGFKLSDPYVLDKIEDLGERVMTARHKERKFGAGCVEKWRQDGPGLAEEFESALAPYELRLAHARHLFAANPVYADFALFGVIGNAEFAGPYELDAGLANLRRWRAELRDFSSI